MTATDPTELALLAAVCRTPADDTPRLVYADWLDEHAVGVPCERCGGERTRWSGNAARTCSACNGTDRVPDGRHERAEFIRVQVELAGLRPCVVATGGTGCVCRACELALRQRGLLDDAAAGELPNRIAWFGADPSYTFEGRFSPQWSRGFVSHVTCTAADWLAHADALCWHPSQLARCEACAGEGVTRDSFGALYSCEACGGRCNWVRPFPATAQPVERVTLTTHPPVEVWYDGADERWPVGERIGDKTFAYNRIDREWRTRFPDRPNGYRTLAVLSLCWPGVVFELPRPQTAFEAGQAAGVAAEHTFMDAFLNGNG